MKTKLLAIVRGGKSSQTVRHYRGLPLTDSNRIDARQLLGPAAFIVIQEEPDGFFLYRFDQSGEIVGDTWHASVEDAKEQARFEYTDALTSWVDVSSEDADIAELGCRLIRLNTDG